MFDRVFDAAEGVFIHEITGCANNEEIANVLIEDNFGSGARVGAGKYDGKRMLRLRSFGSFGRSRFAGRIFAAGKARIALFEFCERGICVDGSAMIVSGKDKASQAQ